MNSFIQILDFTITDLIQNLRALVGFFVDCLSDFADFFTTNTLGQLILSVIIFSVIASLVAYIVNRMK